jgi:signal transduction histidine kinase
VAVRISDTGPGIPPEVLPRIFDPFFTTKSPGEGVGLGLGICHQIVKRHEGRMGVTSEPGHTTFEVLLPLVPRPLEVRK